MNAPSEVSQKVLCKQYLKKGDDFPICDLCGQKHESLNELFDRVSFGNAQYRKILSSFDFLPGSPAIFNAGGAGTLSACFKFDVQDSMASILDVGRKSALVQKWGGGVGYCLSELRPKGAHIKSTHGKACGPVSVMRYYHSITEMITQGGKREGAQMAILDCYHPDIREFIHCKETEGTFSTFNISVAVTTDFMFRVKSGKGEEAQLFNEIVECAWENGDPGLYFIDAAESFNPTPYLGKLTGTNPCGEVPLLDNEACNLGSINLSHFVKGEAFDLDRLHSVACIAAEYLDEVIERNFFPVDEITEATLKTRKIGLGVMGWSDALTLLRVQYDCDKAVGLAKSVMSIVQDAAFKTSTKLGEEKGRFPADIASHSNLYRRNACLTCIAPAGTISTIADCSPGIEPHYSLEYTQIMGDGTQLPRKVAAAEYWEDFTPKVAHEIGWRWHVAHQVAFQKYCDLAVSKTINMPSDASIEDVRGAYLLAWEEGCKGLTVYREGSRVKQAMYQGTSVVYETDVKYGLHRRKLAKDGVSLRHKFDVGDMEGYLHIGIFEDNTPGELFITGVKEGSTISGLLDGIAILTSLALQYGVPLEVMVSKLQGTRFEPAGLTGNPDIPAASSLLDYIFRYLHLRCNGEELEKLEHSGMICPECGAKVIFQEGCQKCAAQCGWSRC